MRINPKPRGLCGRYASGTGVKRSDSKAVEWYTKAAEQDEPNSLMALAETMGPEGLEEADNADADTKNLLVLLANVRFLFFSPIKSWWDWSGVLSLLFLPLADIAARSHILYRI